MRLKLHTFSYDDVKLAWLTRTMINAPTLTGVRFSVKRDFTTHEHPHVSTRVLPTSYSLFYSLPIRPTAQGVQRSSY
jgi:hypothetical protein